MYPQHARTIRRLTERFGADPDVLALIIIGSVARGEAREDSDVDCYLVVTDAAYATREAAHALSFSADDLCDYPGGHAGGRVVDLAYLHDVAARGPEPARYAFTGAFPAVSRLPGLAELLEQIPRYPEAERTEKMISFVSQLPVHFSYLVLGEYSQNPYLLAQTAVELVLFGGRLILAHNRMLYPNRKWFLRELARAPEKPADLLDRATALLTRPGIATAGAFCDSVLQFQHWPQPPEGTMARFQEDRELHWRTGPAPLAER
jgi:hypothetical protein